MHDQAELLRQRLESVTKPAKVCAVVSGKGGVGKSNLTINLALSLIKNGSKVLIMDLDIGMANLDILLGVHSRYNIVDLVEQRLPILELIESGPGHVDYLAGGNGLNKLFELSSPQFGHFCKQMEVVQDRYDHIFLDMGAGASKDSLQFIAAADEVMLVTTPEPTAITDAYAMLKYIQQQGPSTDVSLIVNRVESKREGDDIGNRIVQAARHFLQKEVRFLGMLPEDRTVFKAVKEQKPYRLYAPSSNVAKSVQKLADTYRGGSIENHKTEGFVQRLTRYFTRKQGAT
ncbi:MinD/ParA family protein [Pseudalkalibacillus salsuginis]|uniref:MinD/ParA family protein n=1 Tax=Pseudalkalibacillus salsuginis TaxID=2910972 RepID=UPI001F327275|nr:MinD/ParA family protein [Pseudalkalibacillus salsuginis]MCF6410586.1 MinD/ParA family protein [Pseudalkalibacillus salsuginis]